MLERPELAARIGAIAAEWVIIERRLTFLYGILLGRYLAHWPGAAPPTHPVALQIFDAISSLHQRTQLLQKLCTWLLTEEEAKQFRKISLNLKKHAENRNKVVHGGWGINPSYPDALILMPVFGKNELYYSRDLDIVLDRITAGRSEIDQFMRRVYEQCAAEEQSSDAQAESQ